LKKPLRYSREEKHRGFDFVPRIIIAVSDLERLKRKKGFAGKRKT